MSEKSDAELSSKKTWLDSYFIMIRQSHYFLYNRIFDGDWK